MGRYARYSTFKITKELAGIPDVKAEDVVAVCRKYCPKGFTLTYAIHRFKQWFYDSNRERYDDYVCRKELTPAEIRWYQIPALVTGYVSNCFDDVDHVLIGGEKNYFYKEDAAEPGIVSIIYEGFILYK